MVHLGFPDWLRAWHFLNILFLTFLVRSGLEVLSAHPKLYWNDHCLPASEWLKFTKRKMPEGELWTSKDEEESFSPWVALPGRGNLGLGRHWHFLIAAAWILVWVAYLLLLFLTPDWRRLIPTSWRIFPDAWQALLSYLSFRIPPAGNPYNPLQQLTYAAVVFLLTPLTIATGAAMSPAVAARWPWYVRLFGGRQPARSIHFLCLLAFVAFTLIHTAMVVVHGLPQELSAITLGTEHSNQAAAVLVALIAAGFILVANLAATAASLRWPRAAQLGLTALLDPLSRALLQRLRSRQRYRVKDISPYFRVNGRPPKDPAYDELARDHFARWKLEIGGLVEVPLRLSLTELRQMESRTQITKHNCIQGWSAVASWTGVPLRSVIARCRPSPAARYLVLQAYDEKPRTDQQGIGYYYETIDLDLANDPQTILAYAMNGRPLPIEHGAPLRLRAETQLGFKMVKYVRALEFVADYRTIGVGRGGFREDFQHYGYAAGI